MNKTILQNITIVDKNGVLLFNQDGNSEKTVVNKDEIQLINYSDKDLKIELRNLETKNNSIWVTAENIHKCPKALWNKLSGPQKLKYNEGFKILLSAGDLYYASNGKTCWEEVIAHNTLILLSKIM